MTVKFLKEDLSDVKTQIKNQFNISLPKNRSDDFSLIHKRIFCLSDLVYQLKEIDSTQMIFLDELRSDLVYLLTFTALDFKKPLALSMRSCIEDTIRHIYYKDHPIELQLLNETGETKISVKETFDYLNKHPLFNKLKGFDLIYCDLHNQYGSTSKLIHGSSLVEFQLSKTISELGMSDTEFKKLQKDISKLIDNLITSLIIFHKEIFKQIHYECRSLILSCIAPTHKKIIYEI
jgi:hypothetical protein